MNPPRVGLFVLAGVLSCGGSWIAPAAAEFVLWKNERGELHITNQPKDIPAAHRGGATTLDPSLDQLTTKSPTVLWEHRARSRDGVDWVSEWRADGARPSQHECERDRRNRILASQSARAGTPHPDGFDFGIPRMSQVRFYCFAEPYDPR